MHVGGDLRCRFDQKRMIGLKGHELGGPVPADHSRRVARHKATQRLPQLHVNIRIDPASVAKCVNTEQVGFLRSLHHRIVGLAPGGGCVRIDQPQRRSVRIKRIFVLGIQLPPRSHEV